MVFSSWQVIEQYIQMSDNQNKDKYGPEYSPEKPQHLWHILKHVGSIRREFPIMHFDL